jgi:hypothetical protein
MWCRSPETSTESTASDRRVVAPIRSVLKHGRCRHEAKAAAQLTRSPLFPRTKAASPQSRCRLAWKAALRSARPRAVQAGDSSSAPPKRFCPWAESASPAPSRSCLHAYAARGARPRRRSTAGVSLQRGAPPSPPWAGRRTSRASQAIACAQLGRLWVLALALPRRQAPGRTSMVVVFVRTFPFVKIWISCDLGLSGCSSATHPSPTD